MSEPSTRSLMLTLLALTLLPLGLTGGADAQQDGDHIVLGSFASLSEAPLPGGPLGPPTTLDLTPEALAAGDDGTLYAIAKRLVSGNFVYDFYSIAPDGTSTAPRTLEIGLQLEILDLAMTREGRLYLLAFSPHPIQGAFFNTLWQIDPASGEILALVNLATDELQALAYGPPGQLWAIGQRDLLRLDPTTGTLYRTGISFDDSFFTLAADRDSGGALWLVQEALIVSPPFYRLARLDPVTGTLRPARIALALQPSALAIRHGCVESGTTRCLLGGRFRASVRWRDFDNRSGEGRVAPRGSADSALFWFFDPANWELLVKMVDGCDDNGHYWLFAAGTTNVEHSLEVTDLASGEVFTTYNPLGQASAAITAIDAFASCP